MLAWGDADISFPDVQLIKMRGARKAPPPVISHPTLIDRGSRWYYLYPIRGAQLGRDDVRSRTGSGWQYAAKTTFLVFATQTYSSLGWRKLICNTFCLPLP